MKEGRHNTSWGLALLALSLVVIGSTVPVSAASSAIQYQPLGQVEVSISGILARTSIPGVTALIELGNANYTQTWGTLKPSDAIVMSHSFTVSTGGQSTKTLWLVEVDSADAHGTSRLLLVQGDLDYAAKSLSITGSYFDSDALQLTGARTIQFGLLQVTGVISVNALMASNATGSYSGSISAGDKLASVTQVQGTIQGNQVAFNSSELTSSLPTMPFSVVINLSGPAAPSLLFEVNGTFHFAVNGTLWVTSPVDKIAAQVVSVRYTFIQQRVGYVFSVPHEYLQRTPINSDTPSAGVQVLWYAIGRGPNSSLAVISSQGTSVTSRSSISSTSGLPTSSTTSVGQGESTRSSSTATGTEGSGSPSVSANLPLIAALAGISLAAIGAASYVRRRKGKTP